MPKCPKCAAILRFYEKSRRYRCFNCHKFFLKNRIELQDFKERNIRQKTEDLKELWPIQQITNETELETFDSDKLSCPYCDFGGIYSKKGNIRRCKKCGWEWKHKTKEGTKEPISSE